MEAADLSDVDNDNLSASERNGDEYSSNDESTDTRKRPIDSRGPTDQNGPP